MIKYLIWHLTRESSFMLLMLGVYLKAVPQCQLVPHLHFMVTSKHSHQSLIRLLTQISEHRVETFLTCRDVRNDLTSWQF